MRKKLLLLLLFGVIPSGFAQLNLVSFEQIDSLQNIEKRKVVIFIHTDWCQFCHAMKNTTFKNENIIKELNDNFYFIDFNAEEKRTIVFNKATFIFKSTGNTSGIHELAIQLGTINKQLNYPALCILDSENEIIFQHNNYIKPKEFKLILEKLKE
ncbi:thioredoxin family protein [Flavobacterium xinjiangense]|uniref:Thioredoxin-related protein n=1 Tax=Flavobacterium xinjiangense TaxID=178356 RepID=A0A1M7PL46_9FLAO|nr:thioredoxin fold domain-containing protein [Flavobacterium xinjiangense]SHN17982.1 Thioredoxin-related protein [Flavobacterium xinjiangense]